MNKCCQDSICLFVCCFLVVVVVFGLFFCTYIDLKTIYFSVVISTFSWEWKCGNHLTAAARTEGRFSFSVAYSGSLCRRIKSHCTVHSKWKTADQLDLRPTSSSERNKSVKSVSCRCRKYSFPPTEDNGNSKEKAVPKGGNFRESGGGGGGGVTDKPVQLSSYCFITHLIHRNFGVF